MQRAACTPRAILLIACISRVRATTQPTSTCPVGSCRGLSAAQLNATAEKDFGPWNVAFRPGHFVCKRCDTSVCAGCALLCDIDQCTGDFFSQQCWCEEGMQTHKVLCDSDCTGGVCDNPRLRCRSRQEACQPWWWCGDPPPKGGPTGGLARLQGFLQRSRRPQKLKTRQMTSALLARDSSLRVDNARKRIAGLSFREGRYDCFSAAMPPKVWDDRALMYIDRGYIMLDRRTCKGDLFDNVCFCWDHYKYLNYQDPLTSELLCDQRCGLGPCAGKTCSRQPPPSLPPPGVSLTSHTDIQIRDSRLLMEPVDAPVVRNKN